MGAIVKPAPVLLFSGILAANEKMLAEAKKCLVNEWGELLKESEYFDFSHTQYYKDELGDSVLRCFFVFKNLIDREKLAEIKIRSNEIEESFLEAGKRQVNIDPGYMELSKLILASTKNFTHRIHIGSGIYADLTLIYTKGHFKPLQWTYPDYQKADTIEFFEEIRSLYYEILKEKGEVHALR